MTTPSELNKILFSQLNTLSSCNEEALDHEADKSMAMVALSKQIIDNNNTRLAATRLMAEYNGMSGKPVELNQSEW